MLPYIHATMLFSLFSTAADLFGSSWCFSRRRQEDWSGGGGATRGWSQPHQPLQHQ